MPDERSGDAFPPDQPPPDLGGAGAAMRGEWRAEQEAATHDAAEQWQHSRTLLDVARDHMHRGDRVAVTVACHRVVGEIVEVASDRIALIDHEVRVDVHVGASLPLMFCVVERALAGGRSGARAATFRARLLELEAAGAPVSIATSMAADRLAGHLRVGTDLIVVTSSASVETVIALSCVAAVSQLPSVST